MWLIVKLRTIKKTEIIQNEVPLNTGIISHLQHADETENYYKDNMDPIAREPLY